MLHVDAIDQGGCGAIDDTAVGGVRSNIAIEDEELRGGEQTDAGCVVGVGVASGNVAEVGGGLTRSANVSTGPSGSRIASDRAGRAENDQPFRFARRRLRRGG